jgi:hypothetical protein
MILASSSKAKILAAAIAAAGAIGASGAQADSLNPKQCDDAISLATTIVQRNAGKISPGLKDSFIAFSKSNCDLNTDWKITGQVDESIFGEFRLKLIALRSAAVSRPDVLAKK